MSDDDKRLLEPATGGKMVPAEATEAMCVAAVRELFDHPIAGNGESWEDVFARCWRKMVAAAPTPEESPVVARQPAIDTEKMLRECVPGGDSCDPQAVCDAIRAWVARQPAGRGA